MPQPHTETAPPRPRSTRLPNGDTFYCSRPFDVPAYYRDVFLGAEYVRHGVVVPEEGVVFDVGANIGMFSYFVGKKFPRTRVFSFEPAPVTYSALYWNVKSLGLTNVTPFNLGLSDAARTVQFTYFPYSAGWSTMYPNWGEDYLTSVENGLKAEQHMPAVLKLMMKVPGLNQVTARVMRAVQFKHEVVDARLQTLSEMLRQTGVSRVDLLKIDVERAEWDVLMGIAEADWPKIQQVVIEVQVDHQADNAARILSLLQHKGFRTVEEKSSSLLGSDGTELNSTIFATRASA